MVDGDLHDYVKKKKFLEEYEAAIVMSDILEAVSYLNDLGIIHRDLKSENIMVFNILFSFVLINKRRLFKEPK
jgi:serine/threonine protein kinase